MVATDTVPTLLQAGNASDGVRSYVPAREELGVTDAGTTTEVQPPTPVTVGLKQQQVPSSCSPHYTKCFQSTVTIVDAAGEVVPFTPADPLLIDLIRAKSTLKKGANINNAKLSYSADGGLNWVPILECSGSAAAGWAIPAGETRCVVPALKKATTGTYVDSAGNWHFQVIA